MVQNWDFVKANDGQNQAQNQANDHGNDGDDQGIRDLLDDRPKGIQEGLEIEDFGEDQGPEIMEVVLALDEKEGQPRQANDQDQGDEADDDFFIFFHGN